MAQPWSPLQHYFPGGSPGTLGIAAARARSSGGGSSPSFTLSGEFWNSSYYNPRTTPLRNHHAWSKPDSKGRHLETLLKGHGTKMQEQMVYEHFQPYLFPDNIGSSQASDDLKAAQDKLKADQDALKADQDALTKDRDSFISERDAWNKAYNPTEHGTTHVDTGPAPLPLPPQPTDPMQNRNWFTQGVATTKGLTALKPGSRYGRSFKRGKGLGISSSALNI